MTSERPPHEQATVEAEHRFRARQVAVRQAESRRRRLIWGTIISVVVVGAVAIGSLYSPLLDVDYVDMRGLRHVEPAEVSEVTGLATGQQMIDLQVADIEAAVVDLPWVERASVVRRWPDTVEIRVTERSPIAIAVIGEQRVVVTEGGYVAGEATAIDAGLATVELVDADPAVVGEDLPGPIADAVALVGEMVATWPFGPFDRPSAPTGCWKWNSTAGSSWTSGRPPMRARRS